MSARTAAGRVSAWAVPVTAVLALTLMLVPRDIWRHPINEAVYRGFDPNLHYVSDKASGTSQRGVVDLTQDSLRITALPDSQPAVQLATTFFAKLRASFDLRIVETGSYGSPLRIGLWSPGTRSGYFLTFGPPPQYLITTELIAGGAVSNTLVGGQIVERRTFGRYFLNYGYHVVFDLDKDAGVIRIQITGEDQAALGTYLLRLGRQRPALAQSAFIPVAEGKSYAFGGLAHVLTEIVQYQMSISWYTADGSWLADATEWQDFDHPRGWTPREVTTIAPARAAFARMVLGAGEATEVLFADLSFRESDRPGENLLGDSRSLAPGQHPGGSEYEQELPPLLPFTAEASISRVEFPALFSYAYPSLTASSAAEGGVATAVLENFVLTLPHQNGLASRIDDPVARALVVALVIMGLLLLIPKRFRRLSEGISRAYKSLQLQHIISALNELRTPNRLAFVLISLAVVAVAGMVAGRLLTEGSFNYDMNSERAWAYAASMHGPIDVYFLPSLVGNINPALGSAGSPTIFPYSPVMAYLSTAIGWIHKLFFNPTNVDRLPADWLIKAFNVPFLILGSVLVYLILRRHGLSKQIGLSSAVFFALNPAIWADAFLYGQTHAITICLMLGIVWAFEKKVLRLAWFLLLLLMLTRPQEIPIGLLLVVFFARVWPPKDNIYALSWSVIAVGILLAPFAFWISPSIPVDAPKFVFLRREVGVLEPSFDILSALAFTFWPLVTGVGEGLHGFERFFYPSSSEIAGGLSYHRLGLLLPAGFVLLVGAALSVKPQAWFRSAAYVPLLALGAGAFIFLKDSIGPTHFLTTLALLILSRRAIGSRLYWALVGIWTSTTFVGLWSFFGIALTWEQAIASPYYPSVNPITRSLMQLASSDWFITDAIVANLLVIVLLAGSVFRRRSSPAPVEAG